MCSTYRCLILVFKVQFSSQSEKELVEKSKLANLLLHKCPRDIENFKKISSICLSQFITIPDHETVLSVTHLMMPAFIEDSTEGYSEIAKRIYRYIRISLENPANQNIISLANMETAFLSLLSYWSCFAAADDNVGSEVNDFAARKIINWIEYFNFFFNLFIELTNCKLSFSSVDQCLHHPNSVSAALRLFVDGIGRYKQFIKKIEDIFWNILKINLYYSVTMDEEMLQSFRINEESSPTKVSKSQTPEQVT